MKLLLLTLLMFLIGCSSPCGKFQYRDYRYNDKVTVIAGFYKGQTGTILDRGGYYGYIKEDWRLDNMCRFPSFKIQLDNSDKEPVNISQTKLFAADNQHVVVLIKKADEVEEKCPTPKITITPPQPEVKPQEEPKKPSTCHEKLNKEAAKCGKDIECRYKTVIKAAKCPQNY